MIKPWNPEGLTQDPMLGNSLVLILFQDSQTVCTDDGKFCTNVGPGGDSTDEQSEQSSQERRNDGAFKAVPTVRTILYYAQEPVNYSEANNCNGKAFISHQPLSNLKGKDDN